MDYNMLQSCSGGSGDGNTTGFPRSAEGVGETEGDTLLVKELNELSMKEREHVLEEVNGLPKAIDETSELVEESLKRLEEEISKIRKRSAYEKALFMAPNHVRDRDFRLMFLRSVLFDPRKGAKRMVNYFHHKLRLFGLDKLVKPITLDDLDQDDLTDMLSGSLQILPVKDRAGRTVIVSFHEKHRYKTFENHHRMSWYTVMSAMEDLNTQRLGFATVLYNVGFHRHSKQDIEFILNSTFFGESLPIRYASMHFCYDDLRLLPLISAMQLVSGKEARIRFRSHYGSNLECLYALVSFGLPRKHLPLDDDYNVKTDGVINWMRTRRELEEATARKNSIPRPGGRVDFPRSTDIVLGRGRPFQEFPGNVRLALIIDQYRATYQSIDRLNKTALSLEIVKLVKNTGGRFLKRCEDEVGGWIEVTDDVARGKTSHGFRTKTRRMAEVTDAGDLRKRQKVDDNGGTAVTF